MKILTKPIEATLRANSDKQREGKGEDFKPAVKLFVCVGGNATWLLTEMDEDGIAFGLCDHGHV